MASFIFVFSVVFVKKTTEGILDAIKEKEDLAERLKCKIGYTIPFFSL